MSKVHPSPQLPRHQLETARPPTPQERVEVLLRGPWFPTALAGLALVVWVVSIPFVQVSAIDGWGLLSGLPAGWYVAYAIAAVALLVGLGSATSSSIGPIRFRLVRGKQWVPAFGVLLLILFATTALVYDAPRYPWTYKHIGVTEYLLLHGVPAPDLDIYQNFPGFFYLVGLLHGVTQIPLLLMARWSEVATMAVNAVVVYWAVGALTRSTRERAVTVVLFTLANWIGQTYFAPQALAFPLALVVIGIFLRLLAAGHGRPAASASLLIAEPAHRNATAHHRDHPSFWTRPAAALLCVGLFAVIVVSHQFTPIAVLFQVGLLVVVFRVRRPWLLLVCGVLEGLWVLTTLPYLTAHFSLLEKTKFDNIRPPAALDPVLTGARLMLEVPHVITVIVALATIGAALRALRSGRLLGLVVPGALLLGPALILAVQPYGQEGILRTYLFALPWCCFLIARDLLDVDRLHIMRWRRRVATLALTAVLAVLAVPATLGNEMINHIDAADVAADRYFEEQSPRGSELLLLVPAYPSRSTGPYDQHVLLDDPLSPSLLREVTGFSGATATGEQLLTFTKTYAESRSAQHDLVLALGPTQRDYLRLYGLVSDQAYLDYLTALQDDPAFTTIYAQHGSYLFKVN